MDEDQELEHLAELAVTYLCRQLNLHAPPVLDLPCRDKWIAAIEGLFADLGTSVGEVLRAR